MNSTRKQFLARLSPGQIEAVKLRRALSVQHSTADKDLGILKAFFNWCIDRGLAATNPVCRVKFFHANNERVRYLQDTEWDRLQVAAAKLEGRSPSLIDKMVCSPHRTSTGESVSGAIIVVDWLNRVVRVPRTKNNLAHAVPLNDTAHATLKRLYAERDVELDSPYVFVHPRDGVIRPVQDGGDSTARIMAPS